MTSSSSESNSQQAPAPENTDLAPIAPVDPGSERFQQFTATLKDLAVPEEKIALGLQFMRDSISQEGTPRFKEFWEARRQLLPFFKQNLNSAIRSKLWGDYVELTVEARRLKEILEEQSAFAMEQIDLAIQALENDSSNIESLVANAPPLSLPSNARSLTPRMKTYTEIQGELSFFNALASRLNGLRKEIIKTEMRIRFKTKFFKRLSDLGDQIFPKRKQLIEQISQEFERDVDQFIAKHFQEGEVVGAPYYALREEIKALQGMAKVLTLNTAAFTKTRLKLSECWDQVKLLEKEHKHEVQQKRQVWTDNAKEIEERIEELRQRVPEMELKQLDEEIDLVAREMRQVELSKEDVRFLRTNLFDLRTPFLEKLELERKELERLEKERLQHKKEQSALLKEKISLLQKEGQSQSAEDLIRNVETVQKELAALGLSKFEIQQFDRLLRSLKDLIVERKESALLNLSDDQRLALEQLREVLKQRKQRRQEIKDKLKGYRKTVGGSSGFDFGNALDYQELIEMENERLEKIDLSIEEIEEKIGEIEEQA